MQSLHQRLKICPVAGRYERFELWVNRSRVGRWVERHPRAEYWIAIALVIAVFALLEIFTGDNGSGGY